MKIASIDNYSDSTAQKIGKKNSTSFKSSLGMGALGVSGALMQGIENQGYFLSFLIQDGLGMTLPRVVTGFYRDREVTGEYNVKEGLEVLGREGMTGPFMMAVAPFMVWLTGKFCKSASTNTKLIKTIGENFKSMLEKSAFSESIKNDKAAFLKEFYEKTIEKAYKDTVPGDKQTKETLDFIKKEFNTFVSSSKRKERNRAGNKIVAKINEQILNTSSKLDSICTMSLNVNGKTETFGADAMLKAIKNYGIDAIEHNKNFKDINASNAENIKNNFAAKRLLFNVGSVAATLGGLSILPKIYAYNTVAPGATRIAKQQEEAKNSQQNNTENNPNNINFKGKGINSENVFSKIGKFLHEKVPNWVKQEFEYNGINFTPSLMACLSLFGLLAPRCLRAYNRAFVYDNGKKDMTEIHEILLRDTISSLGVVFTVPILQKLFVSLIENKKGFVLTNRASDRFIDKINPYSKLKLLSNKELQAIYGNVDTKDKMLNFAKYIDEKGGDLEAILKKSENTKEIFNEKSFTLDSIAKEARKTKNNKIIALFEKMENNSNTNELISKLMNDAGKGKKGSIVKMARGFNSIPGFLVTVIISPIILGVIIPMITYALTRKTHAKMENANKENKAAA